MTDEEYTRSFFDDDQFVKMLGIEIKELTQTQATVTAQVKREFLNANGCVQGGMLYTMADFAFAVLQNHLHPMTVTQGGQVHYVRPAYTQTLTAVATETLRAGRNTLSQVQIFNDKGEVVCVCNFNGFVKDVNREEWTWAMKGAKEQL